METYKTVGRMLEEQPNVCMLKELVGRGLKLGVRGSWEEDTENANQTKGDSRVAGGDG